MAKNTWVRDDVGRLKGKGMRETGRGRNRESGQRSYPETR